MHGGIYRCTGIYFFKSAVTDIQACTCVTVSYGIFSSENSYLRKVTYMT